MCVGDAAAGGAHKKSRPVDPGGALLPAQSVAVRLADARPDQGEGLTVVDEVGVDRSREARIIELDREVVAALARALRPGGADLGAADIDPMARSVLARPVGLGNDAHALALQAQGEDLALELGAGLLEGADIRHATSPWLSEPATIAASMAICGPKAIPRGTRVRAGAQRRMAAVRLSCLARNGRSPGEESRTAAIAGQVIEAKPSFGQIKPSEAALLAVRQLGKEKAAIAWTRQVAGRVGRRRRNSGGQRSIRNSPGPDGATRCDASRRTR